MKPISNDFKNELLEFGRQYENKIGIYDYISLATESNDFLVTEDNNEIVARVSNVDFEKVLDNEDLYSIKIITKGEMLSTLMKELDFETTEDIEVGRVINYQFGLIIPDEEEPETEYIDYGNFIIYKKEYDEATERYTYTCYDYMLRTMRTIGGEFRINTSTITGANLIKKICEILTIDFDDAVEDENNKPTPYGMIGHKDVEINYNAFMEYKLTYRDLLGLLCQYFGVSMYMDNNELKLKLLGNIEYDETSQEWYVNNDNPLIVATLNASYLKDSNVSFKNKYGKINALEITGIDESNQQYIQDAESVTNNGLTLYSISKNILFNDDTIWTQYGEDITEDIFKLLNGIEYELNEISTNGVMYLDWLDFYNIEIKGTTYKCLLLNSEITITSGIEENIYTDIPEETVEEYTSNPNNRDDVIADSIRARGNVYATNVEASGKVEANTINANILNASQVGEDLREIISSISPYTPEEVIISDEEPTSDDWKIWIDSDEIGTPASEITNEYSTSIGKGYSANYINNLVVDSIRTKNMFDKTTIISDKRMGSSGEAYSETGYFLSDYIPIKSNTTYTISRENPPSSSMNCYSLYDSNKTFISRSSFYTTTIVTFTTASNAKYIRITDTDNNLNSLQLEKGSSATSYSNYQYLGSNNEYEDYVDISSTLTKNTTSYSDVNIFTAKAKKNGNTITLNMIVRRNSGFTTGGSSAWILVLPEKYRPRVDVVTTCGMTADYTYPQWDGTNSGRTVGFLRIGSDGYMYIRYTGNAMKVAQIQVTY